MLASLLTLSLIPLSLAAPLAPRAAADIVSGVNKVSDDLIAFNKTLNTLKANDYGSTIVAFQIQQETTTIQNDLQALINATKATGDLDSDDSNSVALAVVNLEPNIESVLNNVVVHKPAFATAIFGFGDLSKTVEQTLETQQSLSDEFGNDLIPKLAEPYRSVAPTIVSQINGYFDTAIAAYKECTGKVCLPPISSSSSTTPSS